MLDKILVWGASITVILAILTALFSREDGDK